MLLWGQGRGSSQYGPIDPNLVKELLFFVKDIASC